MKKLLLLIGMCFIANLSFSQNNSLDFDGTNDFVRIADHADFNALNSITVEAWIFPKFIDNPGTNVILEKRNEWKLAIRNGELKFASLNNNPGFNWRSSNYVIPLDSWSHVAVTYDGVNYNFYINGLLTSTHAADGQIDPANTYNQDVTIGKRISPSSKHFEGNIDEVQIWNTARTANEVFIDMSGNINCPQNGLIASYSFNQGVAYGDNTAITTLNDCTGNHSGVIRNFDMIDCISNFQGGFQPGVSGISITGNFAPCPEAIETYEANGFHTDVTWSLTGGTIIGSTDCTVTIEWDLTPGVYVLTALEGGVGSKTETIVVSGDISIACNDLVNISVDSACQAIVVPAMVLEGEKYPDLAFYVTVYDKNGSPITNNQLTKLNIGQVLNYTVTHFCSGNTCRGQIRVEDKWIPQLLCSDTALVTQCGLDTEPETTGLPVGSGTDSLRISDNQFKVWGFDPCDTVIISYYDDYTKYTCNTENYAQIIRHWTATDNYGNTSNCVDTINIQRGSIATVQFPPNYDSRPGNEEHLECNGGNNISHARGWNQLASGFPSPHPRTEGGVTLIGTGYPQGVSCDHIAVTFRDTKIESCGATYKLLRVWRVFDWCTGELKDTVQLIKVIDNMAPVISCPGENGIPAYTVGIDYYKCTASYDAPLPVFNADPQDNLNIYVIEECSNWTYTVRHIAPTHPDSCTPQAGIGTEATLIGTDSTTGLPLYRIENMPQGCNWIYYTITDDCGYSTECSFEIFVEDNRQPVAVCDQHTAVSLSEFGEGTLYATSVDNGSFDNCSLDSMAVRRMTDPDCGIAGNTEFGSYITFCCEDIPNNPIMVVFRVWDEAGNFNDCMVEVEVQDKIAPELDCPQDIRIQCYQDYKDLSITGRGTAYDICSGENVTYVDIDSSLNQCGIGWVKRRWIAEDDGGRVDICDQLITIVNSNPFDKDDITWSNETVYVDGCSPADAHPDLLPIVDGRPIIDPNAAECAMIVTGFEDSPFYNIPGVCIKIIRIWTVIDWCQFDRQNPNSSRGTWKFQQTINITNTIKPTIDTSSCVAITADADDNCNALIDITATGNDDCTLDQNLVWWYKIDFNRDGSVDLEGIGNIATENVPSGAHWFTWYVKDNCGNTESCTFNIDVHENKEPTPYCRKGIITTLMGGSGEVEIWASDFNIGSFDNCTPDSLLRYSFSSDVDDKFRKYTCDSLENGISDTFSVQMWVTDQDGNQDFCTVDVIIQDNMDICPDIITSPFGIIAGGIQTANNDMLSNAKVTLLKDNDYHLDQTTSNDGVFSFNDLEKHSSYEILVQRNDDHLNGVSTRDLVAIQKHLLGVKSLESPYKMIAADANGSESISTIDISILRKLILGKISKLPNSESWTMLERDYIFNDQQNPWNQGLPTSIKVNSLDDDIINADFIAVKVGDVTGNARANNLSTIKTRSEEDLELSINNQILVKGKTVVVEFTSDMFSDIEGMQFTLSVDPAFATINDIIGNNLDLNESNVAWNNIDRGLLTFSWNSNNPINADDNTVLFELVLEIQENTMLNEILEINSAITTAEAYRVDEPTKGLTLRYNDENISTSGIVLYQNRPNPFNNSTIIEFELPKSQYATISILDITGKRILLKKVNGQKGKNSVLISKDELTTTGIMYYQLESGESVSTRKMLLLN